MDRYLAILNLLLITAVIYFSVDNFYAVTTARLDFIPQSPVSGAATASSPETASTPPVAAYDAILNRNLFQTKKKEAAEKAEPQVPVEELKQTELKLKLWGTVSGDNKSAYAVIEDEQKREQSLYRAGDAIQNAMVRRILREKVILNVNGKDEVLEMEDMASLGRGAPGPVRRGLPVPRPAEPQSRNINLDRSQVDEAVSDLNSLMKQARIRPHFSQGRPDGLTLTRVRPNSIFTRLGLRSGDIITAVDGRNIESVDDALGFYESLKDAANVSLQIKRRGRIQTIDYNIQ